MSVTICALRISYDAIRCWMSEMWTDLVEVREDRSKGIAGKITGKNEV